MAYIDAHQLNLHIGETETANIGSATDCELQVAKELIEKAGTSASFREYITGLSDWGISASGFIQAGRHTSLIRHLLSGTQLKVDFMIGAEKFSGVGYLTSANMGGGTMGKGKWNISLKGSGALE